VKSNSINPDFTESRNQLNFRNDYMRKIYQAYHFDESLGIMDLSEEKKISLQDIYVPLQFSENELEETWDWNTSEETMGLLDVLKNNNNIIFSGKPGSGKTTISRMVISLLSSDALTNLSKSIGRRIPLYFKLRDYNFSDIETPEDLFDEYLRSQGNVLGTKLNRDILEFYLKEGWCFLIFDGVDEVGGISKRLKIRSFVLNHFSNISTKNYILVTSRPSGLLNAPFDTYMNKTENRRKRIKLLKLFYIDSFKRQQVNDFSFKWFKLRDENPKVVRDKANDFINSLDRISSLAILRRRPVFLTMMAHIHTTKGKLPYSRAQAYEYMVQAYIESLDITRRLHQTLYKDEKFLEWSFEDKIRLLQNIAYISQF